MNVYNASAAVLSLLGFAATAQAAVEVILCSEPSFGDCVTYNVNTGGCVDLATIAYIESLAVSSPCSIYTERACTGVDSQVTGSVPSLLDSFDKRVASVFCN